MPSRSHEEVQPDCGCGSTREKLRKFLSCLLEQCGKCDTSPEVQRRVVLWWRQRHGRRRIQSGFHRTRRISVIEITRERMPTSMEAKDLFIWHVSTISATCSTRNLRNISWGSTKEQSASGATTSSTTKDTEQNSPKKDPHLHRRLRQFVFLVIVRASLYGKRSEARSTRAQSSAFVGSSQIAENQRFGYGCHPVEDPNMEIRLKIQRVPLERNPYSHHVAGLHWETEIRKSTFRTKSGKYTLGNDLMSIEDINDACPYQTNHRPGNLNTFIGSNSSGLHSKNQKSIIKRFNPQRIYFDESPPPK